MAEEQKLTAGNGAETQAAAAGFFLLKPKLVVPSMKAEAAVAFYKAVFGAVEVRRDTYAKRKADQEQPLLVCAEIKIGGSTIVICDQSDDSELVAGEGAGGVVLCLETENVAGVMASAVEAGAVVVGGEAAAGGGAEVEEAKLKDPFGVVWVVAKKSCCSTAVVEEV
ncbi:Uncharacterized protein M6B38_208610 [Iris pallida]|uniref:Glyoxalase At5g48480-like N-terminal domain-containing protein n=1 Tax=Iris pallida TaxID=29817 RepID=A0AAX6E565_IRIPA|nr:Uncharacterized protein M6B38_208610 [Iris pallida]